MTMAEHNDFFTSPSSSPWTQSAKCSSARRSLASHFTGSGSQPQHLCRCQEATSASKKPSILNSPSAGNVWRSLGVDQSELSLALSLPTGQSFRWKLTAESEYTGVVDNHLFTLRQTPTDVEYMIQNSCTLDSCGNVHASHDTHHSSACSVHVKRATAVNICCTSRHLCVCSDFEGSPWLAGHVAEIADRWGNTAASEHTCMCQSTHGQQANKDVKETADTVEETADTCCETHDPQGLHGGPHSGKTESTDPCMCPVCIEQAELSLKDYLNLDTSLKDVWAPFVAADTRFAALAPHMAGARLLRQRPLECLFQFICSSNNHIQRISQMVDHLASLGPYLGTIGGISFHAFPSLKILAKVSEAELRKAGFGYRAKYIVGAVKELQSKEGGGEAWLYSLRASALRETVEGLCSIPGVGPKVAACIALFSLDQHHAIPVDTHVWKIATSYIMPELSGERLTAKLHAAVSEAFVQRFGKYAGWAQNVLFIAELSSHQLYLPEHLRTSRDKKLKSKSRKKAKT